MKALARSIPCSEWSVQTAARGSVYLIAVSVFITTVLSLSSGQVLGMGYMIKGKQGYRGPACVRCLVQIYILSHLLLANTLQGQCHCPLFTEKKIR